jgi:tRNA pseudouridine55 synthase
MDGFINFNKPKGWTTYDCIRFLKDKIKEKKMGHAGNLDPNASGVVVVGLGRATRLLSFVMELEKVYVADIMFGILTDSWDITGEVILKKEVPDIKREYFVKILKEFEGFIEQIPPPFSAVKRKGKRLYEFAKEGILLQAKPKKVFIREIELLEFSMPKCKVRVKCSKGTYIRTLAKDIGEKIGTVGIVEELIRERVGHFSIKEAVTEKEKNIEKEILPVDYGILHFPEIYLKEKGTENFKKGSTLRTSSFMKFSHGVRQLSFVRVYDNRGSFIGVGQISGNKLLPKKIIFKE